MNTRETTLTKKSDTFKLIIPNDVENKIMYTCQSVNDIEWSGVLFTDYTGSITNKDLVITCRDFFIMDIGNSVYTEYQDSPEVINYMMDNNLLDCKIGLVHSHHTMATNPSSTDINTLLQEGKDTNTFVSLIVNNIGKYTAMVTNKLSRVRTIKDCTSTNLFGDNVESDCEEYIESYEEVNYYFLDIEKQQEAFKSISDRLEEIKEIKKNRSNQYDRQFPSITEFGNKFNNQYSNVNSTVNKETMLRTETNTLFDDYCEDESIPYGHITVNKTILTNLAQQLLLCSFAIKTTIDHERWIKGGMVKVFDERFGDIKNFKSFASLICDYITSEINDEELYSRVEDLANYQAITAYDLMAYFETLPTNKYMEIYMEELSNFII